MILAIDSSGMTASVAIVENDKVLAEFNVNNKKTHSQTLLPMIADLQEFLGIDINELDAVAVSKGPGSFTGLRIGSATAKGIALSIKKTIVEISTLEAMAYQLHGTEALICPIMDARRGQVYTGLYHFEDGEIRNDLSDRPADIRELIGILDSYENNKVIFLGDGVPVFKNIIEENMKSQHDYALAFQNLQRAAALGILAEKYLKEGKFVKSEMHRPEYLRLSQAERERMEKANV